MVDKNPSTRRSFLSKVWISLGLTALLQLLAGTVFFFITGRKCSKKNTTELLQIGLITAFPLGSVTLIGKGHFYLARLDDGGFLAISRKCTHLGCAVPWVAESKRFECPCHASSFDMTGNVIKAPAPRALDLYPITFERDTVLVDISNPIKRSVFSARQLVYAGKSV